MFTSRVPGNQGDKYNQDRNQNLQCHSVERNKSEFFIDSILHRRHQDSNRAGNSNQLCLGLFNLELMRAVHVKH